jgi:glycosyltransferase involved in cell wall biosynthesis
VRFGLCACAEVWTFSGTDVCTGAGPDSPPDGSQLLRRRFRADGPAPYPSTDVLAHLDVFGPPASLCTWGLGIRAEIAARRLNILCIGPPGVNHPQVNALMNRARIGVVCGEDDGAPAILTEYMLAGLPVLANERLRCGLDFIRPDTGLAAPAETFGEAILTLLARAPEMAPRDVVLEHWAWERTIERFAAYVDQARRRKRAA